MIDKSARYFHSSHDRLVHDMACHFGDVMGFQLRSGTDKNGVRCQTNKVVEHLWFETFAVYEPAFRQLLNDIYELGLRDGKRQTQDEIKEALGIQSDDE